MTKPQRRFAITLTLFVAWVSALALMAGLAGERPHAQAALDASK